MEQFRLAGRELITGPTIGGILYAWLGLADTLLAVVVLRASTIAVYARIRDRQAPAPS